MNTDSQRIRGARQPVISPVDGSVYAEFDLPTGADIEATVARAVRAQDAWKRVPLAERAAICRRMTGVMVERADAIGTELTWQIGRPVTQSPFEIRRGFQERARYMIDVAGSALADEVIEPKEGFRRFIRREPLGVVLVLAPWNYPYLASVNTVVPAIVAGNSVILKVSQQTPRVAGHYAEAFRDAGLPDGVFQYLHASHDDLATLIADRRIRFVSFTGSVAGGAAVQRAAGGQFIATNLELGGKDPAYVRPDAPLEATIENLVDGVYFNAGQSCCAVERIYVHQDIYRPFVDGFIDLTRKYRLGNPLHAETTLGPMVRASAAAFVRDQIAEAVHQGARAVIDQREFPAARDGTPYVAPQVLLDVDHRMRVMTEETFGPVVGLMAVKNDDEAVHLMNDSRYGLTASIWTSDVDAAIRIGDGVDTGTWFLNRCDYLDPALAWTGVKDSGRGCSLSRLGYESLTRPKSFHLRLTL
ncbi:MAG TPA: aldehyde dehydrogenase family protein [Vicinamibacterales bacterium]|nr:aldehyde dehydrogenase family protein [Vicinamibacterales bacterium]